MEEYDATENGGGLVESWRVYWCENIRSSGVVVYEESEDAGEGNS